MAKEIVNRVAKSSLKTINLERYFPKEKISEFDLKDYLFKELILKEKDFRAALKVHDWVQYQDRVLCVYCSADAIVPIWAYILVASYAEPYAHRVVHGYPQDYIRSAMYESIRTQIDPEDYRDERVIIKGCSQKPVPNSAYVDLVTKLRPVAQSIMFGEACSTVPIFKRPRKIAMK